MTRCDYDVVFYRVFCVTLLAIAFTFTVILTNVFIDIDGLLAGKKDRHNARINENIIRDEFTSEATENDEINYGENEDSYRTKRSVVVFRRIGANVSVRIETETIQPKMAFVENGDSYRTIRSVETQSFLFHIKNPKVKSILANRLSTLLEELDVEESDNVKSKEKKIIKNTRKELPKDVELVDVSKLTEEPKKTETTSTKPDDILHLTMHNILLQGIIGHMDLNKVYKRVHNLIANFNESQNRKDKPKSKQNEIKDDQKISPFIPQGQLIEQKFFEELVNCNELQEQIKRRTSIKEEVKKPNLIETTPNVMIKTIIDITSTGNDKHRENNTRNSKENIKGAIELIYNGKIIKFTRPDAEIVKAPQKEQESNIGTPKPAVHVYKKVTPETTTEKAKNDFKKIPKSYLDKFVQEYFQRFPQDTKEISSELKEKFESKRLKRHIKIKYDTETGSLEKTNKKKTKAEEDELYVEIETHFDSKGMKGEKKKKLIRSLIEKIQKAIHSDGNKDAQVVPKNPKAQTKPKKHKPLHFKKRLQNPLDRSNNLITVNKYILPINDVVHRQLNPISKTIPMQESSPIIGGKSGDEWKKPSFGPGFLAGSKAINSAEMSEVDINYSKVMDVNGIPQRLQKPLNAEVSEETVTTNSYYDVGKMKFFIKDIDGSGFSVGFNQYVDEPPDPETMRLFTGLENVIKTYHQTYDPAGIGPPTDADINTDDKKTDTSQANNEHLIVRRSINKKHDYHSNEYKVIFEDNFLPYRNYRDIFETKKTKTDIEFSSQKHFNEMPLIVDENIFDKNLKPAEIFGLANLFDRKKRSINVKKISNLKSKIKLNRYLNTKAMSTKRIFLNKKRSKRQINKIRIIATDLPHLSKHSDENIFVVSDENVFADRAIVKDVETSEGGEHEKQEETEYIPYTYQSDDSLPSSYVSRIFDGRSRHNPLMSKYPHIFMEEISRSREEYIPDNSLLFGKIAGLGKLNQNVESEKSEDKEETESISSTVVPNVTESPVLMKEEEIVNALMAPPAKANYKVTVKIVPKNMTGLNSGFKEVHTSINKSFNKNGLLYSSLVNVSEISKVIKLNRTKSDEHNNNKESHTFMTQKIKDQQKRMQFLLKQHAKHINEQLNRLNKEKSNIESLLNGDNVTEIRFLDEDDIVVSSKPVKVHVKENTKNEDDVSKEVPPTVTTLSHDEQVFNTYSTTASPLPVPITPPSITDRTKKSIMSTIERNGNLTDQILKKIDKNTEILQNFLKKLTEKIIATTTSKPADIEDKNKDFALNSFSSKWNTGTVQFNQNMVIRKNNSHISIPFVYDYQQPIVSHKANTPGASAVYHGHIHANAIHAKDNSAEKENINIIQKIPDSNNQSRFFIDELENDYKVIQVGEMKKSRDYNMVNGNLTMS